MCHSAVVTHRAYQVSWLGQSAQTVVAMMKHLRRLVQHGMAMQTAMAGQRHLAWHLTLLKTAPRAAAAAERPSQHQAQREMETRSAAHNIRRQQSGWTIASNNWYETTSIIAGSSYTGT